MPYTPNIPDYKPFYIQCEDDASAKNTATEWGLVAKTNPYPALPDPKEPYKNDFADEDGDDEYVADIHYQSFTFQVEFYIKAFDTTVNNVTTPAVDVLRKQMSDFFGHIKKGEFKVYDSYTGLGRQKVRYAGYEEAEKGFKARRNWARLIFSVTFKVNDPITAMHLSSGSIVAIT
ncbi:MAG: hypothetical protein IJK99_09235 [Bacteroidales bacterium]|nr:hypothetical protein [Bacteroidales bacterium]